MTLKHDQQFARQRSKGQVKAVYRKGMAYSGIGGMDLRDTSEMGQAGFGDSPEVSDAEERRNTVFQDF